MQRHRIFRLPVIRGVIALGESLAIGFRALSVSANYAAQEEEDGEGEPAEIGRWALAFAFLVAIGFALAIFKVGPALLANLLPFEGSWFVLFEGLIRVTVFILYLTLLSQLPSLRRVFQYHAAEHKAINAYEAGEELTPEVTQRYSLIHPRCGTAFLLWVMVISVFVYALLGRPVWYWLILEPDPAAAADRRHRLRGDPLRGQALRQPRRHDAARAGLWLQRLTTREPTLDQIEVSIRALREVLRLEGRHDARRAPRRSDGLDAQAAATIASRPRDRVVRRAWPAWGHAIPRPADRDVDGHDEVPPVHVGEERIPRPLGTRHASSAPSSSRSRDRLPGRHVERAPPWHRASPTRSARSVSRSSASSRPASRCRCVLLRAAAPREAAHS